MDPSLEDPSQTPNAVEQAALVTSASDDDDRYRAHCSIKEEDAWITTNDGKSFRISWHI